MMQILPYLIATLIPWLALWLIHRLDLYQTGKFRIIIGCFIAGAIGLYLGSQVTRAMISSGVPRLTAVRFTAPVLEEILKGLLLLYIVRRADFTYFVEGAVYGFAAGIGFAVVENFLYIGAAGSLALPTAINRVISTNLMHASATAILGISLGWARFRRGPERLLLSLSGLLIAMLLHVTFNNVVTRVGGLPQLLFAVFIGMGAAGLIAFAILRGLKEEKASLEEKLNMADRVTKQEAAVVQNFEKVKVILAPIRERFGPKKAEQIERFLILQARIGLLRKSLDKLTDERMKKSVEEQMGKLRAEMDAARRQVGSYAMLYLRKTLPEGESPLWSRLEATIQEKAAARPASGGANLWANLQARQNEKMTSTQRSDLEK